MALVVIELLKMHGIMSLWTIENGDILSHYTQTWLQRHVFMILIAQIFRTIGS